MLRRDIKLTSAPKKQAMELMRRKIEVRNEPHAPLPTALTSLRKQEASERVRIARDAKLAAAAALTRAEAELTAEETQKAALVADLNSLILQSTVQQYKRLETLETRMDGLTARVAAPDAPPPDGVAELAATASSPRGVSLPRADGSAVSDGASGRPDVRTAAVEAARAEMEAAHAVEAAAVEAAASEARSRHVARPRAGGKPTAGGSGQSLLLGSKTGGGGGSTLAPATSSSSGGFAGFAV